MHWVFLSLGPRPQKLLWRSLQAAECVILYTSRHENAPMVPIEAKVPVRCLSLSILSPFLWPVFLTEK